MKNREEDSATGETANPFDAASSAGMCIAPVSETSSVFFPCLWHGFVRALLQALRDRSSEFIEIFSA
jgi:hypothetical protein